MKLVVGLGNPGRAYHRTRHNLGFEVTGRLAKIWNIPLRSRRLKSRIGSGQIEGQQVILANPMTFMNLSGPAVKKLIDYYQLSPENILIVCDDVNLEPGQIRIRSGGSHGGHKGLLSIIESGQTQDFARLRIGVGNEAGVPDLSEYVLSIPPDNQRPLLEQGLKLAVEAAQAWVREGIIACMNKYN